MEENRPVEPEEKPATEPPAQPVAHGVLLVEVRRVSPTWLRALALFGAIVCLTVAADSME